MLTIRRLRLLGAVLSLVLVASACGGDSDSAASTTTTVAAAASDGGSDDGGGGGEPPTTTTTTTTGKQVSGNSGSDWCEELRQSADGESPISFNFFNLTAEQMEDQFQAALDLYDRWADTAPGEIADDVDVFRDAFRGWFERAKELEFDLTAMSEDDEFFTAFDEPAIEAAGDNIDAHSRDVCGVDFNITADDGPGIGGATSDDPVEIIFNALSIPVSLFSEDDIACIREALGPEFEAGITPDWTPTPGDLELLFGAVGTCGIELG